MLDTNSEYSAEARRLANKMWYQNPQNREWKKKYNSNYYRANLGKWSIYAKNAKARSKNANKNYEEAVGNALGARRRIRVLGENSGFAKEVGRGLTSARRDVEDSRLRYEATKLARQQALNEYNFYVETHKKMSVKEAWSDGAKMIRDTGKRFMNKFYDKLIGDEYTRRE